MIIDTSIYSDILNSVKTIQEAQDLSYEIDTLLESVFKTQQQSFDSSIKTISIKTATKIREVFLKANLNFVDKEMVKDFLVSLKKLLTRFKIIKLTIAFEPSYEVIENIYDWVLNNLGNGYILDVDTNKDILGGAIIVFNGRRENLTLKNTLSTTFKTKREEIMPSKVSS